MYVNPGSGGQQLMISMLLNNGSFYPLFKVADNNLERRTWRKVL